jgi:alpha-glucosidase
MDSNGDGIGDLQGIIDKLDYLVWLGVDILWLPPVFPSPMVDGGYDVADYTDIDPVFGTLETFDRLIAEAHGRGLKIVLDFVLNHTSDQHPWFRQSRASRDNPKRDWYIWRDPAPGGGPPTLGKGPPNNWLSSFGGSAWAWDEATGQYYYHAFAKEQPDLNWRNPEVVAALHRVLRFWIDRGVDGFRLDAVSRLIKDERLRNNPPSPDFRPGQPPDEAQLLIYSRDRPEVHDVIRGIRRVVDEYPDRMLIGEMHLPMERLVAYHGENLDGIHLPMNFQLFLRPWDARTIAELVRAYEAALPAGAWPSWVLGNHDTRRVASRIGMAQARVAAMLLLTLRGTPFLYYGDEIGMEDVRIDPQDVHDPREKTVPGQGLGRDPARGPMQWERLGDGSENAGFTPAHSGRHDAKPGGAGPRAAGRWLPVAANPARINVAAQCDDPTSMLTLYRRLIALRKAEPALTAGAWSPLTETLAGTFTGSGDGFAYVRRHGERRLLVALNMGPEPIAVPLPNQGEILLSTHLDREGETVSGAIDLRAHEGVVVRLAAAQK